MKILINVPKLNLPGGVSNHYYGLRVYWSENVCYNVVGKRVSKRGMGWLWMPFDIIKFIVRLCVFSPDVVIVNPSIGKNALRRDSVYLKISQLFKKKFVVFFHGFNMDTYQNLIGKDNLLRTLSKASGVIVLAEQFKQMLRQDGVSVPISTLTTKVYDKLLEGYDVLQRTGDVKNILFLTRVEKTKGIYIALEAYKMLREKYSNICFSIVGGGSALESIRLLINKEKIPSVRVTGHLSAIALRKEFENADIYVFPSYSEGMPTSVLEAMAFGLPVITRKVGGLADFFEDGKMGYITESYEPKDFSDAIEQYIKDEVLTRRVSLYNYQYAKEHFYASKVAQKMEKTVKSFIYG